MTRMPPTELNDRSVAEILRSLESPFGGDVRIDLTGAERGAGGAGPGAVVAVAWGADRFEFAAEIKTAGTPRVLEEAVRRSRRRAEQTGRLPMVVVPYLGEKRVERLLEEGVSGLDLCGNGLVVVPGRLLLRRTGQPNRYPESRLARFAYSGVTSLVPRVFLRRREFGSVGGVRDEVEAAGAAVALSTVSKALARMRDDLLIERASGRIALLQADALLDALRDGFNRPRPTRVEAGRAELALPDVFRRVEGGGGGGARLVLSGASSAGRYAAGMRDDPPTVYTDDLDAFRARMGSLWMPTERFPGLRVVETDDPGVFFDRRTEPDGSVVASPVQAYLELATVGDKRDREIAEEVRAGILRAVERGA